MFSLVALLAVAAAPPAPEPHVIRLPPRSAAIRVRVLILRHTPEPVAVEDADIVIEAARHAARQGLRIKVLASRDVSGYSIKALKRVLDRHVAESAFPGDVLLVHTIGHGLPSGRLAGLGSRADVLGALQACAAANGQRVLWWQLSCFALAGLPEVDDERLVVVSSSPAHATSVNGVQGRIMRKLFAALASRDPALDADGDGRISLQELIDFINGLDAKQRGRLVSGTRNIVFGQD